MATALLSSISGDPLSPEHRQELLDANHRAKKVLRAATVAAFNGWSIGAIAVLSLPFALFDLPSLVIETGLVVVTYNEFRGRNRLRRFDPAAACLLGWNQLALMALLVGYGSWSICLALAGPAPYEAELRANPELNSMLGSIGDLYIAITLAVYGGLIVGVILVQGCNAWYYFTRVKHVEAYLAETPAWIIEVQRSVSST